MIELVILDYLNRVLDVPAYMEKPKDKKEYVVIEKTGSSLFDHINSASFAVQSYAPSLYDAAALNEKVKAAMLAMPATEDISKCSLNSDYNFTDDTTKEYRYQAIYDLVY